MEEAGYVYIVANKYTNVMYVGVTKDLAKRVSAHKLSYPKGRLPENEKERLVFFEKHPCIQKAIHRRRELKSLKRVWLAFLIDKQNPTWDDRYQELI